MTTTGNESAEDAGSTDFLGTDAEYVGRWSPRYPALFARTGGRRLKLEHKPMKQDENLICEADFQIWPCTIERRPKLITVGKFIVTWHQYSTREQPYTVREGDSIVAFLNEEEFEKFCWKHGYERPSA